MYHDWLKLHRKIVNSAVFADPELFKLWVLCLVKANWKDCTVFWEGLKTPIHLKRGQFVTGQQSLYADYYGGGRVKRKSSRTVWRWLKTLEELANIDIVSVKAYSVVTICQYETYQNVPTDGVKPGVTAVSQPCHSRVKPIGSRVSTEEEDKKNQEPKEPKEETVFPDPLNTDRFRAKWEDWLTYRKDNRRVYKSPVSVKSALTQLAKVGEAVAIHRLDEAIGNGWVGFHLDKDKDNGNPATPKHRQGRVGRNTFTEE